jgi:uncharacterized protein YfiM (DUF2279 family)
MIWVDRLRTTKARLVAGFISAMLSCAAMADGPQVSEARRPAGDEDLRFWLSTMLEAHRYSVAEAAAATGLTVQEVVKDTAGLKPGQVLPRAPGEVLRVLPYPGGRHPRIGFLDGAIRPQRDTKFSVFTPWDAASYVVVDLPEAVWSNLGLTYLAHTHVPTIWSRRGIVLPRLEWQRKQGGVLDEVRSLPNGIVLAAWVVPGTDAVRMRLTLTNGTGSKLSDLRVQMCVMLKGAAGFAAQTNDNKIFRPPYAACRSDDGTRWIISAWSPCQHAWGNPSCPCLHSDPQFPDCPPGETRTVRGWLSFYEGKDLDGELRRIEALGWQKGSD